MRNISKEEFAKISKLEEVSDCKEYLSLMLDFYLDVCSNEKLTSDNDRLHDACIWVQTMFVKGNSFLRMLDGIKYSNGRVNINCIYDVSSLFTLVRRIYESVVVFNLLYILPDSDDKKTIIYNLFVAAGLSERVKDMDMDTDTSEELAKRVADEESQINLCQEMIERTNLFSIMDKDCQSRVENALKNHKYRYFFQDKKLTPLKWEEAYLYLRIKKEWFDSMYSFLSLHGHPSYLALLQFQDAYKDNNRMDIYMARYATMCVLSFLSIFIIDYTQNSPIAKTVFDNLSEIQQFSIGMYEDSLRESKRFL